jgi:hypothetical protein
VGRRAILLGCLWAAFVGVGAVALAVPLPLPGAAARALYAYHHYADFTPTECYTLPSAYVGGCLAGARAQAGHPPAPLATRKALFAAYERGARLTPSQCLELPTDSVAMCLAKAGYHGPP